MYIYYFRTIHRVNKFAAYIAHTGGWTWYNPFAKKHKRLVLRHELYKVPAGHRDDNFVNSQPTLIGASAFSDGTDDRQFTMLLCERSKSYRTFWGRMGAGSETVRETVREQEL